ncbi:hypothetical protein [Tahibacter sp.]|uniref:hypothetical protein n=1 Tax=Tahibacter sp. TaxID=2056211 RepID=UPI0028C44C80|nr:hypothetical protein [Tahibacter sp.]
MFSNGEMKTARTVLHVVGEMGYEAGDRIHLGELRARTPAGIDFNLAFFVVGYELRWYRPACVPDHAMGWHDTVQDDWYFTENGELALS